MSTNHTHISARLAFAQILDSSFPSGAFSHSFGLETYALTGAIHDTQSLSRFLQNILIDRYKNIEFPAAKNIYEASGLSRVTTIDKRLSAMASFTFSKASETIGSNIFSHIHKLPLNGAIAKGYCNAVRARQTPCNEIVLLSVFACDWGVDFGYFISYWAKKSLINIAMSALKVSRIKPSEIQRILFDIDPLITSIKSNNKLSSFNPLFDAVFYKRESLEPRLFAS
jgi:urease accessory protein